MPRKNRGYKRGEPFRDATLFVIACEGAVREKEYFEQLGLYSSRVRVKVLKQEGEHKPAPKWLLDSAAKFTDQVELGIDDQLWFVLDTDKWPDEQIRSIQNACEEKSNWSLALSNPCFEVWLFLHLDDITNSKSTTCQELKRELPEKNRGGYNVEKFVSLIRNATKRSLELDQNPHFIPDHMRSKVHLLASQILNALGINSGI